MKNLSQWDANMKGIFFLSKLHDPAWMEVKGM